MTEQRFWQTGYFSGEVTVILIIMADIFCLFLYTLPQLGREIYLTGFWSYDIGFGHCVMFYEHR